MSTQPRYNTIVLNPSTNTVIGQKDSSVIVISNFIQKSKDEEPENIIENDSIQIVVGTNKFDDCETCKDYIDPVLSSAGILINEAISPSYIFNPKRNEKGLNINYPLPLNGDQKNINDQQKNVGTVTLFGDEVQIVSFLNGVNIHTAPSFLKDLRGYPQISNAAGVSLIHGNATEYENLQPMVKGADLSKHLSKLEDCVSQVNNNVFNLRTQVIALASVFAAHVHLSPQIPAGVLATTPSIEAIITNLIAIPVSVNDQIKNLVSEINNVITTINRSSSFEGTFLSDHHRLN